MPALPLSLIRAHLVIDHDQDDQILTHYGNVSAMWISAYTGQPFDPDNALMAQAALLLVAQMYETREAITFSNQYMLPFGVLDLLSPLKDRITGYVAPVEPAEDEVTP
ncbi:phage gp6-like head-tail connector protein [Paracoccus stylophorae]|uniref:Phage gp6-like head-tail connector protein n=1 Tax=Paracoccus stylophorae TaxID=659350 RepID=A0ABY7SRJ0_9RHOB|nr:head-tail connector protein [Paracoccus stylophorae]WCR09583.1 phage gp6-like head-tail connector protein [Paracoccus stylophorae]